MNTTLDDDAKKNAFFFVKERKSKRDEMGLDTTVSFEREKKDE